MVSTRRVASLAALIALGASVAPSLAAGASTTPAVPRPSNVVLSLVAPAVKPGQPTEIIATVRPRTAGRVVTLKRVVNGRLVGTAVAHTNRLGTAVFHTAFGTQGNIRLRAFVQPTAHLRASFSAPVVEDVTMLLPLVLPAGVQLSLGSTGASVLALQQRLNALGYWVGTPDGNFADSTQQAVWALQKVAGLERSGIVGTQTLAALNAGDVPTPRTTSGNAIDVDLENDTLMIVQNGKLFATLNTSTGGGYTYVQDGVTNVATTPTGTYQIGRVVDGTVTDTLGTLWRPRFFYEGYAIHGDSYVPPFPASHGCVRVSNEAIDWIWGNNLAPEGETVVVY